MEQENVGDVPNMPPPRPMVSDAEFARRVGEVFKLFFMHMVCTYFLIPDVKSRDIYVQCAEGVYYTAYYIIRVKDVWFFERLLVTQFLCLMMMKYVKTILGTCVALSIAQILFPGYHSYIVSLYVRGVIEYAILKMIGFKIPEFSYLGFFVLVTGYRYFFHFEYKETDDATLYCIVLFCFWSVVKNEKLDGEDIFGMVILLYVWGVMKRLYVPYTGSLMDPTLQIINLRGAQQEQNEENQQNEENEQNRENEQAERN